MKYKPTSIRTFIGSIDFENSKEFYKELDFEEIKINPRMCYFKISETLGFYLQDCYMKDWVDNSMIFLEVDDLESCYQDIVDKELPMKYDNVKVTKIISEDWGQEFHLLDPSGVLWHFGRFIEEQDRSNNCFDNTAELV